ncbi:MAG: glycosyltransferase family 2 protein, partial [bacterium]
MKPKISIIVPNYNHEKYIEQRLFSIFNQTYQDFEVILLDDASTDKSPEILKSYEHHEKVQSLIINDSNSGSPFLQWQRGIQLSKGDLIWIAESDDYCELNFLEILVNQKSKNTNLIYSQSTDVNELNEVIYH